jgi:hypothetical protein
VKYGSIPQFTENPRRLVFSETQGIKSRWELLRWGFPSWKQLHPSFWPFSLGRAMSLALAQRIDYHFPKLLGGLLGKIPYDQIRAVAPKHCDLKKPSAGVPEEVGYWLSAAHLL